MIRSLMVALTNQVLWTPQRSLHRAVALRRLGMLPKCEIKAETTTFSSMNRRRGAVFYSDTEGHLGRTGQSRWWIGMEHKLCPVEGSKSDLPWRLPTELRGKSCTRRGSMTFSLGQHLRSVTLLQPRISKWTTGACSTRLPH